MVQRLKPDSNPKPPPEHCANCCTAVSPILYYPFLFSLLTDLKDGHDGCRKGIKVCWCVVLKDEPVTKTKWTKRWEKIVNHCFILFSGPISLFRGHGRSCSVLSVFQRAGLCTQLHCTHFFKVTVSLTLFSSIKTNSRFDLFGWMCFNWNQRVFNVLLIKRRKSSQWVCVTCHQRAACQAAQRRQWRGRGGRWGRWWTSWSSSGRRPSFSEMPNTLRVKADREKSHMV